MAAMPSREKEKPMGQNDFHPDIQLSGGSDAPSPASDCGDTSLSTRLRARVFAGRLDREVESGAVPKHGSPLAVHVARLTSVQEREDLARALRHAMAEAHHAHPGVPLRIPVLPQRMTYCEDVVDDITLLLHSPRPVRPRGMARLRMLLADGAGPLYRNGRGSLAAELRGVLAAL
jgi:hypothetical protein